MIKKMVLENILGLTVKSVYYYFNQIEEDGNRENNMEKGFKLIVMAVKNKEYGKMERELNG